MKLESNITNFLEKYPYRTFKAKQLAKELNIPAHNYRHFRRLLRKMATEKKIYKYKKGRYSMGQATRHEIGKIQIKTQGFGFLMSENGDNDIYISQMNMGTALHGDTVKVEIIAASTGRSEEGKVIEIIKRSKNIIVGTYQTAKHWGTVVPDDLKFSRDVVIPKEKSRNAKSGQKVVVQLNKWEDEHLNLEGEIVEILGYPEEPGVDVLSIAKSHNLITNFSQDAEKTAAKIASHIDNHEIKRRVDLREHLCFTIDPDDSKDFDDAVSLKILDNKNYQLGVHIADVSYYVTANSIIDVEARKRGTSVYLVDRVIPMLPESLSNDVCCLKPDQDKLCFSVIMELTPSGDIVSYDIVESIIRSKKRFTYQEVQEIIENPKKNKRFAATITQMYDLSKQLISKRKSRGGLDFGSQEVKIQLNEQGVPVKIDRERQLDSNRIIEEFMVLANFIVASYVGVNLKQLTGHVLPFAYRVHEKPNQEKIKDFKKFLAALGVDFNFRKQITPKTFQQLLQQIENTDKELLVEEVMVRSMMKAKYEIKNSGHFGLALKHYCHFTSPIRRYPDLICHRLLKVYLTNPEQLPIKRTELREICQHTTEREIIAQEAERASIKLKKLEFMENHIGDTYEGIISGVVAFGIFVEITENLVEGLVHITNLSDDYYTHDEQRYRLIGQNSGKVYQLGNLVSVRVIQVDRDARVIDFELIEED